MREIKRISKLELLSSRTLPADDARAVTDFRAFQPIADLHADRVTDPVAVSVMLEVLDAVKEKLLSKNSNLQAA